MLRDLDQLTARTYDVLVVGGGIHGLAIAYDAAQRGLSVALVERDDFGSGSSFNHLRTIHGGLRYLQTLDIGRARESVRERRTLARIAPHAVRPLPFVLPLYRSIAKGTLAMRAGFLLDGLVAADRNRGVPPPLRLPAGRVMTRQAAIERFPDLRPDGLTGAAIWHDYITPESDRLTFAWAQAAAAHGVALANHVEAVAPLVERRRSAGVRAVDRLGGRELEISARVTVNAAGAAIDHLLVPLGIATGMRLVKAMNLVTRRPAGSEALGALSPSGRYLFRVPWQGRALFGTWESGRWTAPDDCAASEGDVAAFIAELNEAFRSLELTPADVTLVHRGAVPAVVGVNGTVTPKRRELLRDHTADGVAGILSVAGTKYTTARAVAERVTDRILENLKQRPVPCRTAATLLPGALADGSVATPGLSAADDGAPSAHETMSHLATAYGTRYREVLGLADVRPEWRQRVAAGSPVIAAQLVFAVRYELALTLNDAVIRRTPLGALGYPGDDAARQAAAIVGAELGWSEERKRAEIERLRAFYAITRC